MARPASIIGSRRYCAIAFHRSRRRLRDARACRRPVTESLDEPLGVVARDELADDAARLGECLEAMEIEAAPSASLGVPRPFPAHFCGIYLICRRRRDCCSCVTRTILVTPQWAVAHSLYRRLDDGAVLGQHGLLPVHRLSGALGTGR